MVLFQPFLFANSRFNRCHVEPPVHVAVVAVGLVLKGETPHFDYVCQGVTQGVMDVQLKFSKPIGYGVLMCNDLDQAIARSGRPGSKEDKGYDSAIAALKLLEL
jgi:6,7-dimethyl-8-ribityllumazine synthase